MTAKLGRRGSRPSLARAGAVTAAVCMAGTLAACGSSGGSGTGGGASGSSAFATKVDSIAAMLPKSIASKGTLNVAAEVYPPAVIQSGTNGAVTGWDVENARAIAAVLGLNVNVTIVPFDGMIAGLAANRYDAAVGEVYVTPARTAQVTFVTDHTSNDAMLVTNTSSHTSATSATALCGLTIGVQSGSAEATLVQGASSSCTAAGKQAINIKTFQDQSSANLALTSGRVDSVVSSASQVAYVVQQTPGQFKLVPLPWSPNHLTGIAIARGTDSAQFAKALQAAANYLIKNGAFQKILDKYNGGQGAVQSALIMPPNAG